MEMNAMRRIVRHKPTGLFYMETGGVTAYEDQAANFPRIEDAVDFCQEHGLLDVDLVVKSGEPLPDHGVICTMRI
jgi:hypothetical protein